MTAIQDGPTNITVTWTPPSLLGDTNGYIISFTTGGGSSSSVNVAGANTNSHTLTGLTNGRTYTISIVATSSTGLVSESVATTAVRLCKQNYYQHLFFSQNHIFLTVPSALVLRSSPTVTSTTITVTGSVPSGSVVTGLEVLWERNTSVGCSDRNQRSFTVYGGFSGSYRITGLEPGNRYTINMTVLNAAGSGPVSNNVTATTMETRGSNNMCTYPVINCCSPQFIQEVPAQSDLVQSLPVVLLSIGERCLVSIVMER